MALLETKTPRRDGLRNAPARLASSAVSVFEALATPHGVDRYLELVHPMLTVREMRAVVTEVRHHPHSTTLTLRPTRQWRGFAAGQYVQVAIDIDGVRHTRCYSPAGSQHRADARIELTVRAHDRGRVSQFLHAHAAPGLVVGLGQAQGEFALPARRPDKLVLISGGSGITPVISMLRTLADEGYRGEVAFLHYAPDAAHVPHAAELRALAAAHENVSVAIVHTRDADGDLTGRFGSAHLDSVAPWHADAEVYVCGPDALMTAVREQFAGERVHTEAFTLTPVVSGVHDAGGDLTFARSDVTVPNTGASLLEQAEAAGLTPEHGCRMGICFSCTQVKRSGCTRDLRTGELHTDPDTEIQLCVSAPVGDVALDI